MRYTRISCMPFRATFPASKVVQAEDSKDAVRQACLCLDRDLEEILAQVNALNVSDVLVDIRAVRLVALDDGPPWNPAWFPPHVALPSYVVLRSVSDVAEDPTRPS
jgi:hypothetical protein